MRSSSPDRPHLGTTDSGRWVRLAAPGDVWHRYGKPAQENRRYRVRVPAVDDFARLPPEVAEFAQSMPALRSGDTRKTRSAR